MSPLDQRITIAVSVGWTEVRELNYRLIGSVPKTHPLYNKSADLRAEVFVPDYLNDLNAMHEVEMTLHDVDLDFTYTNTLAELCRPGWRDPDDMFYKSEYWTMRLVTATASQRAEAYLRTIGKWKD